MQHLILYLFFAVECGGAAYALHRFVSWREGIRRRNARLDAIIARHAVERAAARYWGQS